MIHCGSKTDITSFYISHRPPGSRLVRFRGLARDCPRQVREEHSISAFSRSCRLRNCTETSRPVSFRGNALASTVTIPDMAFPSRRRSRQRFTNMPSMSIYSRKMTGQALCIVNFMLVRPWFSKLLADQQSSNKAYVFSTLSSNLDTVPRAIIAEALDQTAIHSTKLHEYLSAVDYAAVRPNISDITGDNLGRHLRRQGPECRCALG